MALTDTLANQLLDCVTGKKQVGITGQGTYYLALGTAYSGGSNFSELDPTVNIGYARTELTSHMAVAGSLAHFGQKMTANNSLIGFNINSSPIIDDNWQAVSWVGIFTAPTGGTLYAAGPISPSVTVGPDQMAVFKVSDLQLAMDLDLDAPVSAVLGYNDGTSTRVLNYTYTGTQPTSYESDDSSICSVTYGSNTLTITYGNENGSIKPKLGSCHVYVRDSLNHIIGLYNIRVGGYKQDLTLTTNTETVLDDTISPPSGSSFYVSTSNSSVVTARYDNGALKVTAVGPGTALIYVYTSEATQRTAYTVYRIISTYSE